MSRPFRILSLDGGGIRGVFAAAFLAEIEKQLDSPLASYFDLIAGTSTGGIIALALGTGRPASLIEEVYHHQADAIFTPRPITRKRSRDWTYFRLLRRLIGRRLAVDLKEIDRLSFDSLFQAKYRVDGLARALHGVFRDEILEDAMRRLVVPAVDLLDGKTVVFKTPHLPYLTRDRSRKVLDLALATSAAPTYFHAHAIEAGHAYVDGGLWANNPAMIAYAEAVKISRCCSRPEDPTFSPGDIRMLSIGTGRQRYATTPEPDAGIIWWAPRLLDTVMASQSQGIHFQAGYVMGSNYVRCDFEQGGEPWGLDAVEKTDELARLGQQRAHEFWTEHHRAFFDTPSPAPMWFPPS